MEPGGLQEGRQRPDGRQQRLGPSPAELQPAPCGALRCPGLRLLPDLGSSSQESALGTGEHRTEGSLAPTGPASPWDPRAPPWVGYPRLGEQQQPHAMRMTHKQ